MSNRKLKILHGISHLSIGGAQQQILDLLNGLNKDIYTPLVFSLSPGGEYVRELEGIGVPIFVFPRVFRLSPWPILGLRRLIAKENIDILHMHGFYANLYGRLAGLSLRHPPIFVSSVVHTRSWARATRSPLYFAADRVLSRYTDGIIANAEAVKTYLIEDVKIEATKIHVIHSAVNLDRFQSFAQSVILRRKEQFGGIEQKFIGVIARLDPMKGHHTLFASMPLVLERFDGKVKLLVIGDGPLRPSLVAEAKSLGIADKVIFLGSKRGEEYKTLLGLLDLVVLPSKEGEGFPVTILEAMAATKPVIATAVGGVPELITDGENGFLIQPQDVAALAQRIIEVLQDEQLSKELGRAGKKKVLHNFSISDMIERTESLYDELVRRRMNLSESGRISPEDHEV